MTTTRWIFCLGVSAFSVIASSCKHVDRGHSDIDLPDARVEPGAGDGTGGSFSVQDAMMPVLDGAFIPCGDFGQNAACGTCLKDKCCGLEAVCGNNHACASLVECRRLCAQGDAACAQQCADQNSSGVSDFDELVNCMASQCATECPFSVP